jgi:HAMP domain-containing protein
MACYLNIRMRFKCGKKLIMITKVKLILLVVMLFASGLVFGQPTPTPIKKIPQSVSTPGNSSDNEKTALQSTPTPVSKERDTPVGTPKTSGNSISSPPTPTTLTLEKESSWFDYFPWIAFAATFILLISAIGFLWQMQRKTNANLSKMTFLTGELRKRNSLDVARPMSIPAEISALKIEVGRLTEENEKLRKQAASMYSSLTAVHKTASETIKAIASPTKDQKEVAQRQATKEGTVQRHATKKDIAHLPAKKAESILDTREEARHEVFYLSVPAEDGSFKAAYASSLYREGASIYKFTRTSRCEADFQIDDRESSIKSALEFPDRTIDLVCEAENAFNPKATRIFTSRDGVGKAKLVEDKWVVTRKARIRYEH